MRLYKILICQWQLPSSSFSSPFLSGSCEASLSPSLYFSLPSFSSQRSASSFHSSQFSSICCLHSLLSDCYQECTMHYHSSSFSLPPSSGASWRPACHGNFYYWPLSWKQSVLFPFLLLPFFVYSHSEFAGSFKIWRMSCSFLLYYSFQS